MKILIAPNAFKDSMSAQDVASAMAEGVRRAFPSAEIICLPVADGGDGVVDIFRTSLGGFFVPVRVTGPRGDDGQAVDTVFCHIPNRRCAAVEMARASGLALVPPHQRDPMQTTTFGTGELIRAALDHGASTIYVGIGGSATHDAGCGMASALGARFFRDDGTSFIPTGGTLKDIHACDMSGLDPRVAHTRFVAICDVDNPLLGESGAAAVYAPQKGATPEQVAALEAGSRHWALLMAEATGRTFEEIAAFPGGGAAGGLGAGLWLFLQATLQPGADAVCDLVGLNDAMQGATLVLTAEGRMDEQTAFGKAPACVAARAKARGLPCIGLAGGLGDGVAALHAIGMTAMFSLCSAPMTLDVVMRNGATLLTQATEQAVRAFSAGRFSPKE